MSASYQAKSSPSKTKLGARNWATRLPTWNPKRLSLTAHVSPKEVLALCRAGQRVRAADLLCAAYLPSILRDWSLKVEPSRQQDLEERLRRNVARRLPDPADDPTKGTVVLPSWCASSPTMWGWFERRAKEILVVYVLERARTKQGEEAESYHAQAVEMVWSMYEHDIAEYVARSPEVSGESYLQWIGRVERALRRWDGAISLESWVFGCLRRAKQDAFRNTFGDNARECALDEQRHAAAHEAHASAALETARQRLTEVQRVMFAELRWEFTEEERALVYLRAERGLSWMEIVDAMWEPTEEAAQDEAQGGRRRKTKRDPKVVERDRLCQVYSRISGRYAARVRQLQEQYGPMLDEALGCAARLQERHGPMLDELVRR